MKLPGDPQNIEKVPHDSCNPHAGTKWVYFLISPRKCRWRSSAMEATLRGDDECLHVRSCARLDGYQENWG